MQSLSREKHYDCGRPAFITPRVNINSYLGAKTVFDRQQEFQITWGKTTEELYGPLGGKFMLYVVLHNGFDKILT
jgi:linoleate 10R-lipoxygenase